MNSMVESIFIRESNNPQDLANGFHNTDILTALLSGQASKIQDVKQVVQDIVTDEYSTDSNQMLGQGASAGYNEGLWPSVDIFN